MIVWLNHRPLNLDAPLPTLDAAKAFLRNALTNVRHGDRLQITDNGQRVWSVIA